jgi:hypothetical protein
VMAEGGGGVAHPVGRVIGRVEERSETVYVGFLVFCAKRAVQRLCECVICPFLGPEPPSAAARLSLHGL